MINVLSSDVDVNVGADEGIPVGDSVGDSVGIGEMVRAFDGKRDGATDGYAEGGAEKVGLAVGVKLGWEEIVGCGVWVKNLDASSDSTTSIPRAFKSAVSRTRSWLIKSSKSSG